MGKILVVDDDPNIALLIKMTLAKKLSYDIEIAESGEQAIDLINENAPEIILLDVMMPGISGIEVCQIIKSREETKYIPVIMLSARREAEDMIKGMEAGAADYIIKPFNPEELLARVRVHLRIKELEKEATDKRQLEAIIKMSVTLQHEINNPLTGVLGNLELLQNRNEMSDEEMDELLSVVYKSSLKIKELVKQMGHLGKVVSTAYMNDDEMIDLTLSSETLD